MTVVIRPWVSTDRDAVIAFIVDIQQGEFALDIDAERQPDLFDIETAYRGHGGEFWVALEQGRVVGTVAVRQFAPGHGTVRKMFVAPTHRGAVGLAAQLMEHLVSWCRARHLDRLTLGTTSAMSTAQRFYARHGFESIDRHELSADFPVMDVDSVFFTRSLGES